MAIWEYLKTPPWELRKALPHELQAACRLIDQRQAEALKAEREVPNARS